MKIYKVFVDEIPEGCGDCALMRYDPSEQPHCCGIDESKNEIVGNPYMMHYRRHDCPLEHYRRNDCPLEFNLQFKEVAKHVLNK